nr:tyrosine-type recombinase/integrase [Aliikangiella sp. G2MR2-5]
MLPPEIVPLPTRKVDDNFVGHESLKPYILNYSDEERFMKKLPDWLKPLVNVAVNTGARDQELCKLKWSDEVYIEEINTSVFVIPALKSKNGKTKLIVLNSNARQSIEGQRGLDDTWVFPSSIKKNTPVSKIRCKSFIKAWKESNLPSREQGYYSGPHCLRHTFASRLRKCGSDIETRRDLLGHGNQNITELYSDADIQYLVDQTEKIVKKTKSTYASHLKLLA